MGKALNTPRQQQPSVTQSASLQSRIPQRKRTIPGAGQKTPDSDHGRDGPMSLNFVINSDAANGAEDKSPPAVSPATAGGCLLGEASSPSALPLKRRRSRVDDSSSRASNQSAKPGVSGKEAAATGDGYVHSSAASAASPRQLPEIYEAADRGLKTWLGTMGAAHASVAIADGVAGAARSTEAAAEPAPTAADMPAPKGAAESHFTNGDANANSNIKGKDRNRDKAAGASAVHEISMAKAPSHASAENSSGSNRENMAVDEIYIGSRMSQKPMECNNQ
ncbi:hypothetical protein LPJ56_005216 [Coemansia sp. RSA 2599]|nr:hypothetical protein LPJ56_005216 [Coemansia sp. RSA 2599]